MGEHRFPMARATTYNQWTTVVARAIEERKTVEYLSYRVVIRRQSERNHRHVQM